MVGGRTLEQETQYQTILGMIYDPKWRRFVLSFLSAEYFGDWELKYLFSVITRMHQKEKPIQFISVANEVKVDSSISDEKGEQIIDLLMPFVKEDLHEYLDSVINGVKPRLEHEAKKVFLNRGLVQAMTHISKEEYDYAFKALDNIRQRSLFVVGEGKGFWEELENVEDEDNFIPWHRGIPSGIHGKDESGQVHWLDDEIYYRGLGKGQLVFVVGIPGEGKSTLMTNMAVFQSLRGYRTSYYSLERGVDYMKARIYSLISGIPTHQIPSRQSLVLDKLKETSIVYPEKEEILLRHYPAHSFSPSLLRNELTALQQIGDLPRIIYVDYLKLMKCDQLFREPRHRIGYNAEELRSIAQEFEITVVTASQGNREGIKSKKGLGKENMAEDFSQAWTSDLIIPINIEEREKRGGKIRVKDYYVHIDKNTYGESGRKFRLEADPKIGKFFDIFG